MFLITFFKAIGRAFAKIFKSKEAQAVLAIVFEKILPEAKPIVERIRSIIGNPSNATVFEIIDLYGEFNRTITDIADNPTAKKDAVLHLAEDLVRAALPDKYETPLIQSAINLALSGIQAEGK